MKVFEKQLWHLLSLLLLIAGMYYLIELDIVNLSGSLWGVSTNTWFFLSIAIPVAHHIYVLFNWRFELHYKLLTRTFGTVAFRLYTIGFFIFFVARMIFVIFLSVANHNTIQLNDLFSYSISGIMAFASLYAFYSVIRYFGIDRAAGIDHFDPKARELPFVTRGIFKYTNNGMYTYAFLMLYVPGMLYQSSAALTVAIFSHIFIWAHYYFTEVPDMKRIYNKTPNQS